MHKTILHIGSNIGDLAVNLKEGVMLIEKYIGNIIAESKLYTTQAWGLQDQNDFLNKALIIETELSAHDLLTKCQEIESEIGRVKKVKWGPRIIDIDIIFFDDLILETEDLVIPHPRMHERNFVLFPLAEIIPDWKHPILSSSVEQLKKHSSDTLLTNEVI